MSLFTRLCQDYQFGDGTKALVETAKESVEKLGKSLGRVPDFEKDVFDVPKGCRRFILRPDLVRNRESPPPPPPLARILPLSVFSLHRRRTRPLERTGGGRVPRCSGQRRPVAVRASSFEITTSFRSHYFFPAPLTRA